ncbi:MAG: hypothetical protein QM537_02465 [Candidatus Symbiobacter sp.]|nr:hypothetical protein [Candidatus Symbiobacter sp.]
MFGFTRTSEKKPKDKGRGYTIDEYNGIIRFDVTWDEPKRPKYPKEILAERIKWVEQHLAELKAEQAKLNNP